MLSMLFSATRRVVHGYNKHTSSCMDVYTRAYTFVLCYGNMRHKKNMGRQVQYLLSMLSNVYFYNIAKKF